MVRGQELWSLEVGGARSNITTYTRTRKQEFIFSTEEILQSRKLALMGCFILVYMCLRL